MTTEWFWTNSLGGISHLGRGVHRFDVHSLYMEWERFQKMLSSDTVVSWWWSKLSSSKHDNSHNKARIGLILAELRWGRGCTGSAGCLRVWERYGKVEREGLVLYLQMASRKPGVGQSEFVEASSHSSSHNRPSFRLRIASFRPSSLWMRERVSRVSLSTDERWSVSFSRSKQSRVGKNSVTSPRRLRLVAWRIWGKYL